MRTLWCAGTALSTAVRGDTRGDTSPCTKRIVSNKIKWLARLVRCLSALRRHQSTPWPAGWSEPPSARRSGVGPAPRACRPGAMRFSIERFSLAIRQGRHRLADSMTGPNGAARGPDQRDSAGPAAPSAWTAGRKRRRRAIIRAASSPRPWCAPGPPARRRTA